MQEVDQIAYDESDRIIDTKWWHIFLDNNKQYTGATQLTNVVTTTYSQNKMIYNSAIGNYYYNSSKPHALTDVEISYNHSPTTISLNRCDLTYTLFNKVKTINEGDYNYEIKYYPTQQQAVSTLLKNDTIISKKLYADKTFEIDSATNTKYFYVYAYGQPVAVFIQVGSDTIRPYFIHTDHLGSVDVITDKNRNIVDDMEFDVWGNRRSWNFWIWNDTVQHLIDRGFTGHQHLDKFALINMGGRMYDPVVAQFLSPDPYVQMPENPQNYNRYAYALFNPMHWTDPTGLFLNPIFDWDGNLLGTDNLGIQGEAIIMAGKDFIQGMSHEEALAKGTLRSNLPLVFDPNVLNKIDNQTASFWKRPDWDGYLTKAEADAWWQAGTGSPLFVDMAKIFLPGVTVKDFDENGFYSKNFIWNLSNTGKVYGTLDMTLLDATTGEVRIGYVNPNVSPNGLVMDRYDFGLDGRIFRDAATRIGRPSGSGRDFDIHGYGRARVPLK